ncbi:MAG: histidine kinase [Saprospiraceae bacterium]|nr:histidine kinase [Saprospiraceae bacterium]
MKKILMLSFLSSKDLDSLLTTHKVIGYMTYQKQYLNTRQLMTEFIIGNPILLLLLILGIACFLFVLENFINAYMYRRKKVAKWLVIFMVILSYSLIHYNFKVTFFSCILVFIIFQYINQWLLNYRFEKKEFLKFFVIVALGLLFQVGFWILEYSFLTGKKKYNFDLVYSILRQSFIFWTTIATANFLNNLISYISSLRRKSRQLQSVTSTARETAGALAHSEANVNAHFLYNSLHAIAALAPVAPDKTETLALSLSKYYRYTTNRNNNYDNHQRRNRCIICLS